MVKFFEVDKLSRFLVLSLGRYVCDISLHAGLYLSNFIRGGVEVLAVEVDDRANS